MVRMCRGTYRPTPAILEALRRAECLRKFRRIVLRIMTVTVLVAYRCIDECLSFDGVVVSVRDEHSG